METGPESQDIILYDNLPQRKNHKVLFILLAIFGIAIIVLTIVVLLNRNTKTPITADRYVNFITSGKESLGDENVEENGTYYLETMIDNAPPELFEEFYNNARGMLSELAEEPEFYRYGGIIGTQMAYLDMFKFDNWYSRFSNSELVEVYTSADAQTESKILKGIDSLDVSEDSISQYVSKVRDTMNQASNIRTRYREVGCTGKSTAKLSECASGNTIRDEVYDRITKMSMNKEDTDYIIESAIPQYVNMAELLLGVGGGNE